MYMIKSCDSGTLKAEASAGRGGHCSLVPQSISARRATSEATAEYLESTKRKDLTYHISWLRELLISSAYYIITASKTVTQTTRRRHSTSLKKD